MSQSQALAVAVVVPEEVTQFSEDSALRQAFNGRLIAGDINEACFADEDEAGDMIGIRVNVPRIVANAKYGTFHEPGTEELERKKCPDEIVGIMVVRSESATLFPPKEKKAVIAKERFGYQSLLDQQGGPKWICRNANLAHPSQAILNPQLTSQQIEEARRLGIGGATGEGCAKCSAGCWHKIEEPGKPVKNLRMCGRSQNVVWLDSRSQEPVVLQVSAATSASTLKDWLSKHFMRNGRALSLFSYLVRFRWKSEQINGEYVNVVAPEVVSPLGDTGQMESFRAARKSLTWMLEAAVHDSTESAMPDLHEDQGTGQQQTADVEEAVGGLL